MLLWIKVSTKCINVKWFNILPRNSTSSMEITLWLYFYCNFVFCFCIKHFEYFWLKWLIEKTKKTCIIVQQPNLPEDGVIGQFTKAFTHTGRSTQVLLQQIREDFQNHLVRKLHLQVLLRWGDWDTREPALMKSSEADSTCQLWAESSLLCITRQVLGFPWHSGTFCPMPKVFCCWRGSTLWARRDI